MSSHQAKYYQLQNYFQSLLLLLAMLLLLVVIGGLIAGFEGVLWAIATVMIILFAGPRLSPYFILRLYRARLIQPEQASHLYDISHQLANKAKLDYNPSLYYLPSQVLNMFTLGLKKDACIVISDGMLRTLNERELIAVIAHEISHIRNHDLFVMMIADVLSRLTSVLALCGYLLLVLYLPLFILYEELIPWLLMFILVLAPNLSALLQLGLSRTREYNADLVAAQLTGDPIGLANALKKLDFYQHNWFERIFLPGKQIPDPSLLRTHPTILSRIERLKNIAEDFNQHTIRIKTPDSKFWLNQAPTKKPGKRISGLWY